MKLDLVEFDINLRRESIDGRRFYVDDNDEKYPSVTTVLSTIPNPGIDRWIKRMGAEEAERIKNEAGVRGDKFHDAIGRYIETGQTKIEDPVIQKMFNQVRMHLRKIDNVKAYETFMCSKKHKFAGATDCIGDYEKLFSVIDFKGSTKTKKLEWVDSYFMQISAYGEMFKELTNNKYPIQQGVIIMSSENEPGAQIFKKTPDELAEYFQKFLYWRNKFV